MDFREALSIGFFYKNGPYGNKRFFTMYIPTLEKTFQSDSVNEGFYVKLPEDYVDDEFIDEVNQYLGDHEIKKINAEE